MSALRNFPVEIRNLADLFVDLQEKRHKADYDPDAAFPKFIVLGDLSRAEEAIRNFQQVPNRDRRAFAVYVLLSIRNQ